MSRSACREIDSKACFSLGPGCGAVVEQWEFDDTEEVPRMVVE